MQYVKSYFFIFIFGLCCGGIGIFILLRAKQPQVNITNGKVEYVEKVKYVYTTNTGMCCSEYNNLLRDYTDYINTPPLLYRVTHDKIYFSIRSNSYSFDFETEKIKPLSIEPMIGIAVMYDDILSPSICVGAKINLYDFGASIIFNKKTVNLLISYNFSI